MAFEFFLPKNGSLKNIHLNLTDTRNNKSFQFRTSLRIKEEEWDENLQRPVNIYLKKNKHINVKLNSLKIHLTEYVKHQETSNKPLSQRTLSNKIKHIIQNSSEESIYPDNSLLYFAKTYIESRKGLIGHSTYKRYLVFLHLLERFEGFILKRVCIRSVNSDFIRDFILFGKEEKYSENTIYRTIHFVKTILNFVERKGISTYIRELEIKREKQQKEVVTLTENELQKIEHTTVPDDLQAAKNWLLISCYTGQRISDFMHFSKEQLREIDGKICISFTQQKTHKHILLPLHPAVLNTIHRNGNNFLRQIDSQHYNQSIKRIARMANLKESVKAIKRIGYRSHYVETEKWELLSSHIGRRSFASNFYGKIPTPLLMEATGHSSEKMFLKYINPMDTDRILSLSHYFHKTYKETLDIVSKINTIP